MSNKKQKEGFWSSFSSGMGSKLGTLIGNVIGGAVFAGKLSLLILEFFSSEDVMLGSIYYLQRSGFFQRSEQATKALLARAAAYAVGIYGVYFIGEHLLAPYLAIRWREFEEE